MRRLLLALLILVGLSWAAMAQAPSPSPEQIRELSELLRDPAIQAWLQAQAEAPPASTEAASPSMQATMASRIEAMRAFLLQLAAQLPQLPSELGRAWLILSLEFEQQGLGQILLYLLVKDQLVRRQLTRAVTEAHALNAKRRQLAA